LSNSSGLVNSAGLESQFSYSRYYFYVDSKGLAWLVSSAGSDFQNDPTNPGEILFSGFVHASGGDVFGIDGSVYTYTQSAIVFTGKRYQRGLTPYATGDCITIVNANP